MNTDYDSFIKQNLGKPVEVEDPSNLDQCFDWAFAYCDFLNIPREAIRHLYAYQIWAQASDTTRKYFDLIPNTPDGIPQKGDLVIFGTEVGIAGHVCVADGNGDTNSFQSTDQNWNGHKYVEYVWHSYNGCLGWLRPHKAPEQTVSVASSKFAELVDKSTKYDLFNAAGYKTIDDVTKKVSELSKQINDLESENATVNTQASTLAQELAKLHSDDSNIGQRNNDLSHQVDTLTSQLLAVYKLLNATTQDEALTSIQTLQTPHQEVVKQYNSLAKAFEQSSIYKRAPKKTKGIIDKLLSYFD